MNLGAATVVQSFQLRAEESATPVNLVAVPEVGWIESSKATVAQSFQLRAEESETPVNLVAVPEVGWIESSKARPGKRYAREAIH